MSINTQIKISLSLISFMFLDLFLNTALFNTFFSFNLFFVNIFLLGRKYFSNKPPRAAYGTAECPLQGWHRRAA